MILLFIIIFVFLVAGVTCLTFIPAVFYLILSKSGNRNQNAKSLWISLWITCFFIALFLS